MQRTLVLPLLFITVLVMGTAHHLALKYFLYWHYSWFDIPMHILGGVVAAFVFITISHFVPRIPKRYFTPLPTLSFVLVVGLLWELFEIWAGIPLYEPGFGIDMMGDICMDLVGGAVGYFVAINIDTLSHV